ncbi:MAG TPA: hypothetical protein VJR30_19220 [Bradyrhizobium sp.]|nr:hypothetical protein [Bradyrhizobium sp.]
MIRQNRGCFERHDDESDCNEFASSPCYMREVDPTYFGLPPAKVTASARPKTRVSRDTIVTWPKLLIAVRKLFRSISQGVATQVERVEARREVQAVARLHSRNGSVR